MARAIAILMVVVGVVAIGVWQLVVAPTAAEPSVDPATGRQYLTEWHLREPTYRRLVYAGGALLVVGGAVVFARARGRAPARGFDVSPS